MDICDQAEQVIGLYVLHQLNDSFRAVAACGCRSCRAHSVPGDSRPCGRATVGMWHAQHFQ